MLITNGERTLDVTKGAFKSVYSGFGYHAVKQEPEQSQDTKQEQEPEAEPKRKGRKPNSGETE